VKVFTINGSELDELAEALDYAHRTGLSLVVGYDDTDKGFKVKHNGRWSPPIGVLEIDD
jgi:hypothetical protein